MYQNQIEQLTFLLYLKIPDEHRTMFPRQPALTPKALDWQSLERLDDDDLDVHYRHILTELARKASLRLDDCSPQHCSNLLGLNRTTGNSEVHIILVQILMLQHESMLVVNWNPLMAHHFCRQPVTSIDS